MKLQEIDSVDCFGGDCTRPVQIPTTEMETALLKIVIESKMPASIPVLTTPSQGDLREIGVFDGLSVCVAEDTTSTGWFEVCYGFSGPDSRKSMKLMEWDYLRGRARVIEREGPASEHYRVIVEWEFPEQSGKKFTCIAQSNYAPSTPSVAAKL